MRVTPLSSGESTRAQRFRGSENVTFRIPLREPGVGEGMVRGFAVWETLGISIPNPRAIVRMVIPEGLTDAQLAGIEAAVDKANEELDELDPSPVYTQRA